jgi:hypothetical protein
MFGCGVVQHPAEQLLNIRGFAIQGRGFAIMGLARSLSHAPLPDELSLLPMRRARAKLER